MSVVLDCVPGALVLAGVFAGAEGWVHEYPDGEPAPCSSVRTASPTTTTGGALPRPDCAQAWRRARGRQGQALSGALARVLDRPCARRQFRSRRPGRGNGRPAEQGNRPTRTARAEPGKLVDEGKVASRPGVPIPIPTRCREAGERELGTERRSGVCETVAVDGLDDAAGGGEQADALVESGGPDPASGAQVGERKRLLGFGERRRDALVERGSVDGDGLGPLDRLAGRGPGRSGPAR